MGKLVALLRGVNVGGHRRVPMAGLRDIALAIGFRDVATYVQSGNLVFTAGLDTEDAAARLEEAIEGRFGFPVDVVARTASRWRTYVSRNPFPDASAREPERVMLLLSKRPPRAENVGDLEGMGSAGERVKAAGGAVWIHYPGGAGRSSLTPARIDRLLGSPTTARNWKTVLALGALLGG